MRSWGTRWDGNIGIHLMKAFHQSRFPQVACGSCGLEMTGDWRWVEMARGDDWNAFSAQKALLSGNHKSRNKNTRACPKKNLRVRSDCATLNKTPIPSNSQVPPNVLQGKELAPLANRWNWKPTVSGLVGAPKNIYGSGLQFTETLVQKMLRT